MKRVKLYKGKTDKCECGNLKIPSAQTCRACWIKENKAEASLCKCGRPKWKNSQRCFQCKIKEEHNHDDPYYWQKHDYCKCGNVKKKEVSRCRACFYKEKRERNMVCRVCGVKLTDKNRYPASVIANERLCKKCNRAGAKHRYESTYKERYAEQRLELKREVIMAYGGICECCQERNMAFLSIDHLNGDGRTHRETVPGSQFYKWLKKNKFPKGFRVLCHNCNFGSYINGGVCPHQQAKRVKVGKASGVKA